MRDGEKDKWILGKVDPFSPLSWDKTLKRRDECLVGGQRKGLMECVGDKRTRTRLS